MKHLVVFLFIAFFGTSVFAQLRSGEYYSPPDSKVDSIATTLSLLPTNFDLLHPQPNIQINNKKPIQYNKKLRTTGWLLKNVFLHNKYHGFGFYPYTSMADFDTRSVQQYNAINQKYSIIFN